MWYPQRLICHKTMELAAVQRKWASLHPEGKQYHNGDRSSWVKERSDSHPYHYDDGVRLWVSDVDYSPDDNFLSAGGLDDEVEDESGE